MAKYQNPVLARSVSRFWAFVPLSRGTRKSRPVLETLFAIVVQNIWVMCWKKISEFERSPLTKSQNLMNVRGLKSSYRVEICLNNIEGTPILKGQLFYNVLMKWRNPFRRRGRDGIIPTTSGEATSGRNYEFSTSHERQFQFPKSWFSRRGEKQIPTTRGGASSGRNSFFHYNC